MRVLNLLLIGLLSYAAPAQNVNEVFKRMNAVFSAPKPLQFETKYSLYKDHTSKQVKQSYDGIFMKNASNEVYMRIDKTEFFNTQKLALKISHSEKAMEVSDKTKFSTGNFDVSKLVAFCKIVSFKSYKNYWEVVLQPKELSGLNYSKIILVINKNYTLQKQVFYYNIGFDFSKDYKKQNISMPRLEIEYSKYSNKVINPSKLNTGSYLVVTKNNVVTATSKFKNYEVTDRRVKVSKTNKSAN